MTASEDMDPLQLHGHKWVDPIPTPMVVVSRVNNLKTSLQRVGLYLRFGMGILGLYLKFGLGIIKYKEILILFI